MDINKILQDLGLNLSNPDAKKGATEAIQAILQSRIPMGGLGGMTPPGGEVDVEIDPDLIQPSDKQPSSADDDIDAEINDEENILDQVKRNKSEEDSGDTTNNDSGSNSSDSDSSDDSSDNKSSNTNDESSNSSKKADDAKKDDIDTKDSNDTSSDIEEIADDDKESVGSEEDESEEDLEDDNFYDDDSKEIDANENPEDEEELEGEDDSSDDFDEDDFEDEEAEEDDFDDEIESDSDVGSEGDSGDSDFDEEDLEDEEADFNDDFDEDDLIDDSLKDIEDAEIKTKANARKIKRERTLTAAKNTLDAAKARNAAPALVRELEKAIEALEALTEAVKPKNIKDVSDEEFNLLVNRVFDAIDALGDKSLTFTTDEERQLKAKEIKADMASSETQHELSAEDAALIRDEHQATKARDKEASKYQARGRSSFKGFQDFLNSLYRAIALQVSTEEERNDSWSAISRRNSGAGVIQQGKRIQDLNNKRIPVIDFYFDQSASWDASDIKIGEKAVSALADMEADGKIKINIYYFANHVHTDASSARDEGGTRAWNDIVKNIVSTNAANVIIMTDDDMENWWEPQKKPPLTYTVPGYVWYLWKDGYNAPRLPRDLKGRGGVQQFSFSASDI